MKKKIFNIVFLITMICGTMYFLLRDQELSALCACIKASNKLYLALGVLLFTIYITFESWIIHYLLNSLNQKINIFHCIKYSFIGFFICAITPSASGGQPAQIYYMKQDGIGVSISSLVVMIITAEYKAVLLVLTFLMLIFNYSFVLDHMQGIEFIMFIGIITNIIIVVFLLLAIFKQSLAKKMIGNFCLFLGKHGIIKNHHKLLKRFLTSVSKYDQGASFLKEHKMVVINTFIITILQRIALFSITYVVYKSFGLKGVGYIEIISLQLLIALAVDNLPIPGGIGANEGIFLLYFKEIFTTQFLTAGLLLSRGLSYYLLIVTGALVLVFAKFMTRKHPHNYVKQKD